MTLSKETVLAVVPARGGSKGIPKKNLANVGGLSLVGRAALLCREIDWITHAIISTDSQEIKEEAVSCGLDGFYTRPNYLANDTATSHDVWRHALRESEKYYGMQFTITILLEPTSPLRQVNDILQTVMKLVNENVSAAVTLSPTSPSYTPHKTIELDERGLVKLYLEDGTDYSIRQKIPQYYHRNGLCCAARRDILLDDNIRNVIEQGCVGVIIDRPVVNIDVPLDIILAEWLLNRDNDNENL